MYTNILSSFIRISFKLETVHMPKTGELIDQVYPYYSGVQRNELHHKMDEPPKHYAEQKKLKTAVSLYNSIYIKFLKNQQ